MKIFRARAHGSWSRLAIEPSETGVPVVPAAVVEIEGRTVVRFGAPLESDGEEARTVRDRIRASIADLFA
jgi:hypothetical protein